MPWLFFAYPLLAHIAILMHSEKLAWAALTVFAAVPLLPALLALRIKAWLLLLGVTAALYGCASSGIAGYLMYLPPVLIPASVMLVFARSLRNGQVPLVTRMATQIRGPLPPELQSYTRHVTQFWVVLLAALAIFSLACALLATPKFWSLMTNLVQYLVLAGVFLGEYLYRRLRYRHLEHESFVSFVGGLFKARPL